MASTLQGLVFLAFGFNLVDCGGLLGGRLDSGDAKLPSKKVCAEALHVAPLELSSPPPPPVAAVHAYAPTDMLRDPRTSGRRQL